MNKIKFFRELNNLSQTEVADKLFMSQNSYSRYETDPAKLSMEHFEVLAKLYSVAVDVLKSEDPFIILTNDASSYLQTHFNYSRQLIDLIIESKNETIRNLQADVIYWRNKAG